MARVISIYNQAGGAGKTSVCQNVAAELAERGKKVLMIDLDPSAYLTRITGLEENPEIISLGESIGPALLDERYVYGRLDDNDTTGLAPVPIYNTVSGIDIIPSSNKLADAVERLGTVDAREFRLRSVIEKVAGPYEYVFVDCNPNLNIMSMMALTAADGVIVPVETSLKGKESTKDALKQIKKVCLRFNSSLKILAFVMNHYDSRRLTDKAAVKFFRENLAGRGPVVGPIPEASVFRNSQSEKLPIRHHTKNHPIIDIFVQLGDLILEEEIIPAAN